MKKLTNISPFILLLVPVFAMIILTFAASLQTGNDNTEMALRSSAKADKEITKVSADFIR